MNNKKPNVGAGTSKVLTILAILIVASLLYYFQVISLGNVLTLGVFLLVLSSLVFIHELGHFVTAILIGVRVEEFGFGIPPRAKLLKVLNIKNSKVDLTLNWLPIGGFVRLAGEDEEATTIEELEKKHKGKSISHFFWARSTTERAAILLAGVTMNFLLAVAIMTGLLIHGIEEPAPRVKIQEVLAGSPAETAGLLAGDLVREIRYIDDKGNNKVALTRIPQELLQTTKANLGRELTLILLRDGQEKSIVVTPRKDVPEGEGPMGIRIDFDVQVLKYPWYEAPFRAVGLSFSRTKDMMMALASLPSRALQGQNISNEVAGPIGIAQVTGQAARIGPIAVLNLMSILSLSLAILNVMPFPALDGGRLLFVIVEAITGKRVHQGFERRAHQIGMLILLGFIALVTFNDISKFFTG